MWYHYVAQFLLEMCTVLLRSKILMNVLIK